MTEPSAAQGELEVELEVEDSAALGRVTRVLRAVGALLLVASASVFMLQHWSRGNDLLRYSMLLSQTAVLALAGVVCGAGIREARSARTFMALAATLVPVNFTVVAALLYSQFSWDAPAVRLPGYALWQAPSATSAVMVTLTALPVLAGLCVLAMLVLARPSARMLSGAYLALNALLLLPVRNPSWVGLLFGCGSVAVLRVTASPRLRHSALHTREGVLARGLLLVPLLLLVGRACWFYQPTRTFNASLLLAVSYALFAHAKRLTREADLQKAIEAVAAVPAALACLLLGSTVRDALDWPAASAVPSVVLPYLAILVAMSRRCTGNGHAYRSTAAVIGATSFAVNLACYPSLAASFSCLGVGVVALAFGAYAERKLAFAVGACAILYGAGHQLEAALHLDALLGWGSLSLLGIALIVIAALFERDTRHVVSRALQSHWRKGDAPFPPVRQSRPGPTHP